MQTPLDPSGTLRVAIVLRCGPTDPITCENAIVVEDVTQQESADIVQGLRAMNPCVTFLQEWTAATI